jgi:hypothetical protein
MQKIVPALWNIKPSRGVHDFELSTVWFVHEDRGSLDLKPAEYFFGQLEQELIEAQVDLGLDFVVEEPCAELH